MYTGSVIFLLQTAPSSASLGPSSGSQIPSSPSVDEREQSFFRKSSDKWWKPAGEFKPLLAMNELRVPLVRDSFIAYSSIGNPGKQLALRDSPSPLQGAKILDVGCGGGLFSEPLARMGATVTGIDIVEENVENATEHWRIRRKKEFYGNISYFCSTVEDFSAQQSQEFDVVVCSEVIEHVADAASFVQGIGKLTRNGGIVVFTTINRTITSFGAAIVGAEYLSRIVARGTHQWAKFVRPEELGRRLEKEGFNVRLTQGMVYNPVTNRWSWSRSTAVSYAMVGIKCDSF